MYATGRLIDLMLDIFHHMHLILSFANLIKPKFVRLARQSKRKLATEKY